MTTAITILIVLIVGFVIGWIFGQRSVLEIESNRNVYDEIHKVAVERNDLRLENKALGEENEILQDRIDRLQSLLSKYDKQVETTYHSPRPPKPTGTIKPSGEQCQHEQNNQAMNKPIGTTVQQPAIHNAEVKGKRVTVSSPLLTRKQLALILQVSEQTVKKRASLGLIKQVDVCGKIRYPADKNNVLDYIEVI